MSELSVLIPDYYLSEGRLLFKKEEISFPGNGLYLLKGKNGSGKTTLLSFLTGQIDNDDIILRFDGKEISKKETGSYFDYYVSYLPQDPLVFYDKTPIENILFPYEDKNVAKAEELLISLGLKDCMNKSVSSFSYGEKQRLAFARMLYQPKRILLLDEIDSGLDEESAFVLKEKIQSLKKKHIIILSTQLKRYDDIDDAFVYEIKDGVMDVMKEGCVFSGNNVSEKAYSITKSDTYRDAKKAAKENKLFYGLSFSLILIWNIIFMVFGSMHLAFTDTKRKNESAFENIAENANGFLIEQKSYEKIKQNLYVSETFPILDPTNYSIDNDYSYIGSSISGIVALKDFSALSLQKGRLPEKENEILVSDLCYETLKEKKDVSFSDRLPISYLSDYVIVGTYQSKYNGLSPEYIKSITDDGDTFTFYRSMYLFMTETIFVYENAQNPLYYMIANNKHTRNYLKADMIANISIWNERVLLDNDLSPIYKKEKMPVFGTILFYLSLPVEALLVLLTMFLFANQNKKYYLFDRVGGKNKKRLIYPNIFLYSLFTFSAFFMSVPFSYAILKSINHLHFSSFYLLNLNYISLSAMYVFVSFMILVVLFVLFLILLFSYLVPKKMTRQLNSLKRK